MSTIIKALEDEIVSIGESIEKRKRGKLFTDPQMTGDIVGLTTLQQDTVKLLDELKGGIIFILTCDECGYTSSACDFEFGVDIQDCEQCGNHIRIKIICPKCTKTGTVYRQRQFEGK